jgi:hypothetical protein
VWSEYNYAIVYYMSQLAAHTSNHTDHHPCSETKCIANNADLKQSKGLITCGAAAVALRSILVEKITDIFSKGGMPLVGVDSDLLGLEWSGSELKSTPSS